MASDRFDGWNMHLRCTLFDDYPALTHMAIEALLSPAPMVVRPGGPAVDLRCARPKGTRVCRRPQKIRLTCPS